MPSQIKFICSALVLIGLSLLNGCGPGGMGSAGVFPGMSRSGGPTQQSYTIVLAQLPQESGLPAAQELRDQARLLLGVQDIWLENDRQWVSVNYGHFVEQLGANTVQQELKRVREPVKVLYSQMGLAYQFCYIKELPQPDPPAESGW